MTAAQDVESKRGQLQALFAAGIPQVAANALCPFMCDPVTCPEALMWL